MSQNFKPSLETNLLCTFGAGSCAKWEIHHIFPAQISEKRGGAENKLIIFRDKGPKCTKFLEDIESSSTLSKFVLNFWLSSFVLKLDRLKVHMWTKLHTF